MDLVVVCVSAVFLLSVSTLNTTTPLVVALFIVLVLNEMVFEACTLTGPTSVKFTSLLVTARVEFSGKSPFGLSTPALNVTLSQVI